MPRLFDWERIELFPKGALDEIAALAGVHPDVLLLVQEAHEEAKGLVQYGVSEGEARLEAVFYATFKWLLIDKIVAASEELALKKQPLTPESIGNYLLKIGLELVEDRPI